MIQIKKENQSQIDKTDQSKNQAIANSFVQPQSQFFSDYQKLVRKYPSPKLDQLTKSLLSSGKIYIKDTFKPELTYKYIDTDLQSNLVELHYGVFATQLRLINMFISHQLTQENSMDSGHFGKIYRIATLNKDFDVVKIIGFKQLTAQMEKQIFQEYFIALLASQLMVGPKIIYQTGYDIIFMKDYAIFRMEECLRQSPLNSFQHQKQILNSEDQAEIIHCMRTFHSLNIIHRDMKSIHISWSVKFQKYVLLDFGFSSIIQQSIGQKTLTSFRGTYTYCSQQMKKIFAMKNKQYVDLYYNDMFGLFQAIKSVKNRIVDSDEEGDQRYSFSEFFTCLFYYLQVKVDLFKKNYRQALNKIQQMIDKRKMLNCCVQVLKKCLLIKKIDKYIYESFQFLQKQARNIIKNKYAETSQDNKLCLNQKLSFQNTNSAFLTKNEIQTFILISDNKIKTKVEIQIYQSYINLVNKSKKQIQYWEWVNKMLFIMYPDNFFNKIYRYDQVNPTIQKYLLFVNRLYSVFCCSQLNQYKLMQHTTFVPKFRFILIHFLQGIQNNSSFTNLVQLKHLALMFWLLRDNINVAKVLQLQYKIEQNSLKYIIKCFNYYFLQQNIKNTRLLSFNIRLIDGAASTIKKQRQKQKKKQISTSKSIQTNEQTISGDTQILKKTIFDLFQQLAEQIKVVALQNYSFFDDFVSKVYEKMEEIFKEVIELLDLCCDEEKIYDELSTFRNTYLIFRIISLKYRRQLQSQKLLMEYRRTSWRTSSSLNEKKFNNLSRQKCKSLQNSILGLQNRKEKLINIFTNKTIENQFWFPDSLQTIFLEYCDLGGNASHANNIGTFKQKLQHFLAIGQGDHRSIFINFHSNLIQQIKLGYMENQVMEKYLVLYLEKRIEWTWKQLYNMQLYSQIQTIFYVVLCWMSRDLQKKSLSINIRDLIIKITQIYNEKLQKFKKQNKLDLFSLSQIQTQIQIMNFLHTISDHLPQIQDGLLPKSVILNLQHLCHLFISVPQLQNQSSVNRSLLYGANRNKLLLLLVFLEDRYGCRAPKDKQMEELITEKLQQMWNVSQIRLLFQNNFFMTLLKINKNKNRFYQSYQLFQISMKFFAINSQQKQQSGYFYIFSQCCQFFSEHTPIQFITQTLIKNINLPKTFDDCSIISTRENVSQKFLFLHLMKTCHKSLQKSFVLRIMQRISHAMQKMKNFSHQISKFIYYPLLKQYLVLNGRKDISYSRALCRNIHNWQKLSRKIERQCDKILKNKDTKYVGEQVADKIKSKIYKISKSDTQKKN